MDGLKFPEWQQTLQDVILERDDKELNHKIENAERLISLQFLRLQHEKDCLEERQALTDALYLLRLLKRKSRGPNRESTSSNGNRITDFPGRHTRQGTNRVIGKDGSNVSSQRSGLGSRNHG